MSINEKMHTLPLIRVKLLRFKVETRIFQKFRWGISSEEKIKENKLMLISN